MTASDTVFGGCSDSGSSLPFSLGSRSSSHTNDEFNDQQLQEAMSDASANCSLFSLESDSSDQFTHQDLDLPISSGLSDGSFLPFSLESLVSDVVVSSPGEEDPDIMMMPFCRSSSIDDSPPSSSKSFDCDSDLDLYFNCDADLGLFNDDTFLDSLLTSNLPDVISNAADDIMSSIHNCNDSSSSSPTTAKGSSTSDNNSQPLNSLSSSSSSSSSSSCRDFYLPPSSAAGKLAPPLPLTSSLATLLQQNTILSPGTGSNRNNSSSNNNKTTGSKVLSAAKVTGHANSTTHATNSHILVQNGQHFTIYKILAAPPGSAPVSAGSMTCSQMDVMPRTVTGSSASHKAGNVTKRFLTGAPDLTQANKRIRLDSGCSNSSLYRPRPVNGNSVLMNLLVNGEDVRNGYTSRKSSSNAGTSSSIGSRSRTTTTATPFSCTFD